MSIPVNQGGSQFHLSRHWSSAANGCVKLIPQIFMDFSTGEKRADDEFPGDALLLKPFMVSNKSSNSSHEHKLEVMNEMFYPQIEMHMRVIARVVYLDE